MGIRHTNTDFKTLFFWFQPAAVDDLRRWTSDEALGDVTVPPNCISTIISALNDGDQTDGTVISDDDGVNHKLPSPEEQLHVVALKLVFIQLETCK